MHPPTALSRPEPRWQAGFVALALLAGLGVMHGPMLLSGFRLTPGDWGDARFVNYVLEHSWRWLLREPIHQSFWDPPFFYPARHVAAYSEILLGAAPAYWVWRLVQLPPDTAYQAWMVSVSALNFCVMYAVARSGFRLSHVGATLAALLFAFASARANQLNHPQLLPQWPSALALGCAQRVFSTLTDETREVAGRRVWWIFGFALCLVWQLWAAFYLGWFLLLAVLLAFVAAWAFPTERRSLWMLLRRHPLALMGAGGLSLVLLAPLASHYLEAAKEVGFRSYAEIQRMLPRPESWLNMGPDNWAWGWVSRRGFFLALPMEQEHRVGIGLVGLVGAGVGLWLGRARPGFRLVACVGLVLVGGSTVWRHGGDALWHQVYDVVPGAQAIRAVTRLGLLVLLPAGLGLGLLFERLTERRETWLFAGVLGAFFLWEQGQVGPTFDKLVSRAEAQGIAAGVDERCEAFLWSPVRERAPYWKVSVDGMWGALEAHKPTFNGYSGHAPPDWYMGDPNLYHPAHEASLGETLQTWAKLHKLDLSRVCWVKGHGRVGENGARILSQRLPGPLVAGTTARAEVTVENLGPSTWSPKAGVRLGAEDPQDNTFWGPSRVELPHDVAPQETVTFAFDIQVPSQPGRYPFRWRMVQDGVAWFGELGPRAEVDVFPLPLPLPSLAPGQGTAHSAPR